MPRPARRQWPWFGRVLLGRQREGSKDSGPRGYGLPWAVAIGIPIPGDRSLLRQRGDPGSDSTIAALRACGLISDAQTFPSRPAAAFRALRQSREGSPQERPALTEVAVARHAPPTSERGTVAVRMTSHIATPHAPPAMTRYRKSSIPAARRPSARRWHTAPFVGSRSLDLRSCWWRVGRAHCCARPPQIRACHRGGPPSSHSQAPSRQRGPRLPSRQRGPRCLLAQWSGSADDVRRMQVKCGSWISTCRGRVWLARAPAS
jgi:hypothetical protein